MHETRPKHEKKISDLAAEYILSTSDRVIKDLKPEDVATAVNSNVDTLSRVFEQDQKFSLSAFIQREKIYRAYFILRKDQNISIAGLSKRLGFLSPRQFNRAFDRFFFIPPGRFRKIQK